MRAPTPLVESPEAGEGDRDIAGADAAAEVSLARAALKHRDFRVLWSGAFASNIGVWMQNVVLGAYAYNLTESATFVSIVYFAQLGPMLLLSLVGGLLADTFDRKKLLLAAQLEQLVASLVLAALVLDDSPNQVLLVAIVFAIGVGNAINAPSWVTAVPALVPRAQLSGAISLNMTQMQGSRVLGPALASVLFPLLGASGTFLLSALGRLAAVGTLLSVRLPPVAAVRDDSSSLSRLSIGFRVAGRDPFVRRILLTLVAFSLLCLPFVGQMPTIAERNLGLDSESAAYGLLYACFGLGAVLGAVSVSTFLSHQPRETIVRVGLVAFAVALATFGLLRVPAPAYPVVTFLGFFYFAAVTSMNTLLQEHLEEAVRGRVMALWLMAFGGTVPVGLLLAGPIADATSITTVLLYGAVFAVALAWYADLRTAKARSLVTSPG